MTGLYAPQVSWPPPRSRFLIPAEIEDVEGRFPLNRAMGRGKVLRCVVVARALVRALQAFLVMGPLRCVAEYCVTGITPPLTPFHNRKLTFPDYAEQRERARSDPTKRSTVGPARPRPVSAPG